MLNEKELPFLAEKGHIVSLVGGGGKTTLLYAMADHCARKGWRVVVMTTTHIRQPVAYYAPDDAALTTLWQAGHYAVIGTPAKNGKLTLPPQQLLRRMAQADAVFIEADGAKHHPCKVPAAHEPVLLPQSDIVLAVAGLSALGKPLREVCFRYETIRPMRPLRRPCWRSCLQARRAAARRWVTGSFTLCSIRLIRRNCSSRAYKYNSFCVSRAYSAC